MSLFGNFFGTEPQQTTTDKTQATTQTYTPSAATTQGAQDTYGWLSTAMAQPYSNMPMQQIAGFTPDQLAAFEATRAAQGQANPWFDQAGNLVMQGAGFDPNAVADTYKSLSDPVFASMANQFGQQRSEMAGNLRSAAGGTGADRINVGLSNLANQQGLAMGQTGGSLMRDAINAELQKRQLMSQSGTLMGALGAQKQGLTYQDIAAQYGMGGQQQQLSQAEQDALYQYGLGQFMYPSQIAQLGAGITAGLAPSLGGTTTGTGTGTETKTVPGQPLGTTLAGLGMTGLGVTGATGGLGSNGWLTNLFKPTPTGAAGGRINNAVGGRVDPYSILAKYNHGGMVPHYEDGGDIPFDERWGLDPFQTASAGQAEPFIQQVADRSIKLDPEATERWREGTPATPDEGGLPSIMTAGMRPRLPAGAMAYAGAGDEGGDRRSRPGVDIPPMPDYGKNVPDKSGEIYRNPWMALTQAGLGTLASIGERTGEGFLKYPGIAAVGKGGLHGVEMLREQQKSALEEKRAEREFQDSLERARHWRTSEKIRQEQADRPYRELTAGQKEGARKWNELTASEKEEYRLKERAQDIQKERFKSGLFDDETTSMMAEQALRGDKSVFTSIARGVSGPQNLVQVRQRMNELAKERGMGGADLAAANANFTAQAAAARTAAVREANIQTAVEEAKNTFPLALKASEGLPRGKWVPINQAIQAWKSGTSDPALGSFAVAVQGAMIAYSQAMSRTGVNSVHAQQRAEELLSTVKGPEDFKARIKQMDLEMDAALRAPEATRQAILDKISGKKIGEPIDTDRIGGKRAEQKVLSDADRAALKWANENPNDPRAAQVKKDLGVQ